MISFEPMREEFTNIQIELNTTSSSEHVPDNEPQIPVIKERSRACRHTFPFKHTPRLILVAMLINYALCLNDFPPKELVSTSVSPCTIPTGINFEYHKHLWLKFGHYSQVNQ